jgi:K+-sensing histidine kinase KdpD
MATVMRQRARTAQERLENLIDLQSLLAVVAREIGPALELGPVLQVVLGAMRSMVDFTGGTVGLVDEGGVYVAAADPDNVSDDVRAARVPIGTGLSGRIVATGRAIYSPDVTADERVDPALRAMGSNAKMRSYLGVPLVCLGSVIGVLQVDAHDVDAFDADDMTVLEGLATQVAGAIESARRYEQVMELERLKGDFVARVSHELKTPLTIISGFIATLKARGENLTEQQHQWLDRIVAADGRLSTLIDELLTVTTFEAGMTQPHAETVAVGEVFERVRAESVDAARVQVSPVGDLALTTDRKLLSHALALLVDNALKYAGDAHLSARTVDRVIILAVRDNGPGVPAELRGRIFDRFTRGDHTGPGMGLGLPIVANLAGALGARVELESPPGGGTEFRLVFV